MKKRYIVIGIFLIVIVIKLLFTIGIVSFTKHYDVGEIFHLSGKVVESGTYNSENYSDVINNFEKTYKENIKNGEKTFLVVGNKQNVKVISYEDLNKGEVDLIYGESTQRLDVIDKKYTYKDITPINSKVEFIIDDKDYSFNLDKDEKIYLIISQKEVNS